MGLILIGTSRERVCKGVRNDLILCCYLYTKKAYTHRTTCLCVSLTWLGDDVATLKSWHMAKIWWMSHARRARCLCTRLRVNFYKIFKNSYLLHTSSIFDVLYIHVQLLTRYTTFIQTSSANFDFIFKVIFSQDETVKVRVTIITLSYDIHYVLSLY